MTCFCGVLQSAGRAPGVGILSKSRECKSYPPSLCMHDKNVGQPLQTNSTAEIADEVFYYPSCVEFYRPGFPEQGSCDIEPIRPSG